MNSGSLYTVIAAIIGFGVTALLGIWMIPFLHKLKFGQTIREIGPAWHKNKQGTPTMGGLMFIIGTISAVLVVIPLYFVNVGDETMLSIIRILSGLLMAVGMGVTGFMDDYISIKKHRNLGLTEKQKLLLQFLIVGSYFLSIGIAGGTTETIIPFVGVVDFGWFYYIAGAVIIVGMVNAVNFTDGIDGLNSTVTCIVCICLMSAAFVLQQVGIAVLAAASAGACIGFLVWNYNPAKVFMGDTGSLFLGGIVCAIAFGLNIPILLVLFGIIYIVEIISVVLQVTYFKATKGKRLFKMSPIHHHFEMCGWSENKICGVFGLVTLVFGIGAVACVIYGI